SMNMPYPRHGKLCVNVVIIMGTFARDHDLGRVLGNDSGVITERAPDTVRGADIAFYSYARLPRGPLPKGYAPTSPEIIFEVLSPGDRSPKVLAKVAEYLEANVLVVCVLDPQTQTLTVYRSEQPPQVLGADEELTLPELHPDFRVVVRMFLEE